jgi:hypothetical protein
VVYIYAVIYPIHRDKKVDGAIAIAMVFEIRLNFSR